MLRTTRLPSWLKVRLTFDEKYRQTAALIKEFDLNTVCHGAGCPNRGACFSEGTATFMILGETSALVPVASVGSVKGWWRP